MVPTEDTTTDKNVHASVLHPEIVKLLQTKTQSVFSVPLTFHVSKLNNKSSNFVMFFVISGLTDIPWFLLSSLHNIEKAAGNITLLTENISKEIKGAAE